MDIFQAAGNIIQTIFAFAIFIKAAGYRNGIEFGW
jgi:hypothetical protein